MSLSDMPASLPVDTGTSCLLPQQACLRGWVGGEAYSQIVHQPPAPQANQRDLATLPMYLLNMPSELFLRFVLLVLN